MVRDHREARHHSTSTPVLGKQNQAAPWDWLARNSRTQFSEKLFCLEKYLISTSDLHVHMNTQGRWDGGEMGRQGEKQRDTEVDSQAPPQTDEARMLGTGSNTWF